jgi:hypothetical protein
MNAPFDLTPPAVYTTKRAALAHYLSLRQKYLQRAHGYERDLLERTFSTLIDRIERMPDDVLLRVAVEFRPAPTRGDDEARHAGPRWNIAITVRAYTDQTGETDPRAT